MAFNLAQGAGHGVDGVVYFGDSTLSPATHVVLPLAGKFTNRARDASLLREAWFYEEMEILQAAIILRLYGSRRGCHRDTCVCCGEEGRYAVR